jgi:hypothetical protein
LLKQQRTLKIKMDKKFLSLCFLVMVFVGHLQDAFSCTQFISSVPQFGCEQRKKGMEGLCQPRKIYKEKARNWNWRVARV